MNQLDFYRCPVCKATGFTVHGNELICENQHRFYYQPEHPVIRFAADRKNRNEFTQCYAADIHDNALAWLFATFNVDEQTLRQAMIAKLQLQPGQNLLVTSAGAGNDLPYLATAVGPNGKLFVQDFAEPMLMAAISRAQTQYALQDYNLHYSISDATNLPFQTGVFDAVYHFGGLNLFSDIKAGIAEMDRVTKQGGRVVFGDEGLAPWLRDSEIAAPLIKNNPLYQCEVPLDALPHTAQAVNVNWVIGNCFYLIDYTVSKVPLAINMDIEHVGRRGGSIRTRYYGQLEGISPQLRDKLYVESERRGISRVELLEDFINRGLENA